jgi:hypothetical protein
MTTPAIDPTARPDDQRFQALTYADAQGWLSFEHVTPGRPVESRYVITVAGVRRRLHPDAVLPYVQGHADARDLPALFPNREDEPPA